MSVSTILAASTSIAVAAAALAGGECNTGARSGAPQVVLAAAWVQPAAEKKSDKKDKAAKDIVDTAVAAGSFNTLAAALEAAGLIDALRSDGPFTVFAPTDEAFAKLPAGTVENLLRPENIGALKSILTYHVVSGRIPAAQVTKLNGAATLNGQRVSIETSNGAVLVDGAKVVTADVKATNGVIHVIDTVILPEQRNIVEVATSAGSFETLAAALSAAGLVDALQGDGPFTVFAPTDEAFGKLPAGTVENLLKPENIDTLKAILTYHVVPGRVFSEDVVKLNKAATLNGADVKITVANGGVMINDANVVITDINASNGVIHVIDTVILPPNN